MTNDQLGIIIGDGITYSIIGKRRGGSFRKDLRDWGFDKAEIDRVIGDLDCDRDVIIQRGSTRYHLRAL